jgi:hypothetical protein
MQPTVRLAWWRGSACRNLKAWCVELGAGLAAQILTLPIAKLAGPSAVGRGQSARRHSERWTRR